ncbi:Predicted arabinose efflux permease, MFS family [Chitinophaga jiangningensis]|uniref:Predicted arabinose efflux permease, MFS family n=1 Tax=Chitinophaga jiangningensis TaxID=1419482 RepID=A0A1M7MX84_9BACT|nr:MFS transporter [Chitinophaga jiangningensis]SHM95694.1 Predicted arabinose efflux permease, MFS family [Chitinophaga jiangningensis]
MDVFRSLRSRNFRLFFSGQSVSMIGTWMQKTAVCWLVYRLTGSALLLGVVSFAGLIPSLILAPYAGSYIDRHNRYKVLVRTQVISMLQALALALLVYFKYYNITGIILLTLLLGIINAFDVTCRQSLMVDMVTQREDLPNAIALNSTMMNFARIAGPALAGIILSNWGENVCFALNFFSYIPIMISLFMMKLDVPVLSKSEVSIWTELRAGFHYISHDKDLSSLLLMLTASSLLVMPFNTLMPMFAKDIFNGDAKTFSWFESAAGVGSIISAIYMARLKPGKDMIKILITASCIFSLSLLLLSYAGWLPMALVFMTCSGIGMMAQTSAINTYIQTHAQPQMRARAISYYIMAYQGMIPVGSLLAGALANMAGPKFTVLLQGIAGAVAVAVFVSYRRKHSREWDNSDTGGVQPA